MPKREFNMINWPQIVANLKIQLWRARAEGNQRDAFRFIEAREKWAFEYDCVLQANDGCDLCDPADYDLDFCPFKIEVDWDRVKEEA